MVYYCEKHYILYLFVINVKSYEPVLTQIDAIKVALTENEPPYIEIINTKPTTKLCKTWNLSQGNNRSHPFKRHYTANDRQYWQLKGKFKSDLISWELK